MPWIAFIDLLGTKESASLSNSALASSQTAFHDYIDTYAAELDTSDAIFHFADCCYISCSSLNNFIRFYRGIRYSLLSQGYFFKCAVGAGQLLYRESRGVERGPKIVGGSFDRDVVPIYRAQEAFKGIGITVLPVPDEQRFRSEREELKAASADLVFSCYPSGRPRRDPSRDLTIYSDVRFGTDEVGSNEPSPDMPDEASNFVRIIFQKAIEAKLKDPSYGKYYLSIVTALVGSSDFSRVELDDGQLKNTPPVWRELYANAKRTKALADVAGVEIPFFSCLEQMKHLDSDQFEAVVTKHYSHAWLVRRLPNVPARFLSYTSRERVLKILSSNI